MDLAKKQNHILRLFISLTVSGMIFISLIGATLQATPSQELHVQIPG